MLEQYFNGTHIVQEPTSTEETNQIIEATSSTLNAYGLDVRSISMVSTDVSTGDLDTILWRVDIVYAGSEISITSVFLAALGHNIALIGAKHTNSLWSQHQNLLYVSHRIESQL